MRSKSSRRSFLKQGAFTGAGMYFAAHSSWANGNAPNDRIGFAGIGVGGRGSGDVWDVAKAKGAGAGSFVALCDVDDNRARGVMNNNDFANAKKYRDFREMLQKEEKRIDAVTVATPDHTHASAAVMAMRMGKHCYCEKPLTWSVKEARVMREVAAEKKVATQMGNQGTSEDGLRKGVEFVQAGAIGPVHEVYVWTNRPVWPQGLDAVFKGHSGVRNALHGPLEGGVISEKIRDTLAWNLWLGPAPARPYDKIYLPFNWRGWWDFGTGALGDMACHTMNLPYMALKLYAPTAVEAEVSVLNPETYPEWSKVTYEFGAREGMPPLKFYWFDGKENSPRHFRQQLENSEVSVNGKSPAEIFGNRRPSGSGSMMVGEKGMLYSGGDYGGRWELLPKGGFRDYQGPAPSLPRSPGHHQEWVNAIRGGPPAMSNFNYAGPLTEFVNLGVVAIQAQSRITWDTKQFKITNNDKANQYLHREYRKGWTL